MFTGIITDIGIIEQILPKDKGLGLVIKTNYDTKDIDIGASIACNGVCLTVVQKEAQSFMVEAWAEALELTNISRWQKGHKINLEKSLRLGDELGGHLVSGHVDNVAKIMDIKQEGSAKRFFIELPQDLLPFIACKGSIALDGASLTINSIKGDVFDVLLIEHSLKVTNWGEKQISDLINVEIDQMARYFVRYYEYNKLAN